MQSLTFTHDCSRLSISSCNPAGSLSGKKMVYPKESDPRILELLKVLEETQSNDFKSLSEIHINLMQIYYDRHKDNADDWFEYFFHAKEAFINGHNSGLAPYRLMVCLIKKRMFHQAIEVCSIVTDSAYNFASHGHFKKEDFQFKMKKLKRKIHKDDKRGMRFFTEDEVKKINKNSNIFNLTKNNNMNF